MSTKTRLESLVKSIYSLDRKQIEHALTNIISDIGKKNRRKLKMDETDRHIYRTDLATHDIMDLLFEAYGKAKHNNRIKPNQLLEKVIESLREVVN